MTRAGETNDPLLVILAGGISSRMKRSPAPLESIDPQLIDDARSKPKAMLGVGEGRRPFLDYLLHNIERAGYRQVVIVIGERDDSIRRYYESGGGASGYPSLDLSYAVQMIPRGETKPAGTADALRAALMTRQDWKGRRFTVCNSDNLYSDHALRLLLEDRHENAMIDYDRAALRFDHERIMQFAVIRKDAEGFVRRIVEKPSEEEIRDAADASGRIGVSMNIFRLLYDRIVPFLEAIPLHPIRREKELPLAIDGMIGRAPRSMYAIPLSEHVVDLTVQGDISTVAEYLRGAQDWNAC